MKLGALKSAIRDLKGAPKIWVGVLGQPMTVDAQKTPLLAELDRLYPEGRAQETGLWLRDDGYLMREEDRDHP